MTAETVVMTQGDEQLERLISAHFRAAKLGVAPGCAMGSSARPRALGLAVPCGRPLAAGGAIVDTVGSSAWPRGAVGRSALLPPGGCCWRPVYWRRVVDIQCRVH